MHNLKNGYVQTKYFNYYAMLLIYTFLLLPFLSLVGIQKLLGETAYSAYQSGAMVLLFVLVLFKVRYVPRDLFPWMYLLFNGLIIYSTTQNYGFSMGILVNVLAGFFIILLIRQDGELIIRALTIIAVIALIANFISIARQGLSEFSEYFVGGKNSISIFFVPSAFLVMANAYIRRGKTSWFVACYAAVAALEVFLTNSATGIVTVVAMGAAMLWIKRFKPNVMACILGMILIQLILVFLTDMLTNSPLWLEILAMLGKEATLTSRTMIWEQAIGMLKGDWLLGVGRGAVIQYVNSWGGRGVAAEAHNFFLELLLEGGVLGFGLYVMLIWSAVRNLNMENLLHRIIFICFLVMLVNGLAEAVNNKMYVTIVLALLSACSNGMLKDKHMKKAKHIGQQDLVDLENYRQ